MQELKFDELETVNGGCSCNCYLGYVSNIGETRDARECTQMCRNLGMTMHSCN